MTVTPILISTFTPFNTLSVAAPSDTLIADLVSYIHAQHPTFPVFFDTLTFSTQNGRRPPPHLSISELRNGDEFVTLRLCPQVLGGKGGFGSQLRAAGGRMSSQKTNNNDSCRDLNGRRLSTIKEAKKLAEYVASEPERLAAKSEAQRAKLEGLERKLGIDRSGPSSSKTPGDALDDVLTGQKRRFDDTEYLEKTEELKEGVKNAVSAALLIRKRKKAKTLNDSEEGKGKESQDEEVSKKVVDVNVVKDFSTILAAEQPKSLDAVGA